VRPLAFLASYPRSGNTFLRALLANYRSGLDRPLGAEEIAAFGAGEQNEALWRWAANAPAETRTVEAQCFAREAYIDAYRQTPGEGPLVFKTHTLNGDIFGRRSFRFRPGDRIVYIVRHPLDVLVSAAAFFELSLEAMAERMRLPGAFNRVPPHGVFEVTGSWDEHVSGWLTETQAPLHLVRYETLAAETAGTLAEVLTFLDGGADAARVERAVAFSRFDILKRSAETDGFDQGPGRDRRAVFFREGRTGQGAALTPPGLQAELVAAFGPLIKALGFEAADRDDLTGTG